MSAGTFKMHNGERIGYTVLKVCKTCDLSEVKTITTQGSLSAGIRIWVCTKFGWSVNELGCCEHYEEVEE